MGTIEMCKSGQSGGMRTYHRVHVQLRKRERKQISGMLEKGWESARVLRRALILRKPRSGTDRGAGGEAGRGRLQNGAGIARGYEEKGLESALYERPWPSQPWCLNAGESQRIIAMVCSAPPAGQGRWSVRLIAEEAVKCKWVSRMGRETIPILLRSHDLKPWGKKCGAGETGGGIHPAPRGDFWRFMKSRSPKREPVVVPRRETGGAGCRPASTASA